MFGVKLCSFLILIQYNIKVFSSLFSTSNPLVQISFFILFYFFIFRETLQQDGAQFFSYFFCNPINLCFFSLIFFSISVCVYILLGDVKLTTIQNPGSPFRKKLEVPLDTPRQIQEVFDNLNSILRISNNYFGLSRFKF